MPRNCLFCGQTLGNQRKNFEHIIPKWLVTKADLSSRTMTMGHPNGPRTISMRKIGMKVCESCNSNCSHLEGLAKDVLNKIELRQKITNDEADIFLTWLDKLRVSLWLWMLEFYGGHHDISPKFCVDSRTSSKDRLALINIFSSDNALKGMAFWGITPGFASIPSAFGIMINGIAIINASTDFLVSRHILNFAFSKTLSNSDLEQIEVQAQEKPEKLTFLANSLILAQIINLKGMGIPGQEKFDQNPDISPYAKSKAMFSTSGLENLSEKPKVAPEPPKNIDANLALIQSNLCKIRTLIKNDFQNSNFAPDTSQEKISMRFDICRQFAEETFFLATDISESYERAAGIRINPRQLF